MVPVVAAAVSVLTTFGIVLVLVFETFEFFRVVPFFDFVLGTEWAPLFEPKHFGVLPLVGGTLLVAGIAGLIAMPLGLVIAIYLAEYAGVRTRSIVKPFLEVLAGIPTVAAVKDWSNDIVAFERNLRALRATGRPVAMLSSFTMSLMATFLLGADGAISGMGSVAADLQAELFAACQKGDLDGARRLNDRLDPLVRVFYAPPFVDMHNRMKEALVLLGRLPAAHVRPPLTPVPPAEREAIRAALAAAGLRS